MEKIKDLITSEILVSNNLASVPINTIITEKTINIKNGAASVPSKEKNNNDCKDNNDKPFNDCKAVENKVVNINNGIQDQLDKSIQFQIDSDGLKLSKEINLLNNTNGDIIMNKNHEEKCSNENQDLVKNCDKDLKITSEQQDEHATSSSEEIVTIIHVINENVDEADASKDLNFSIPDSVCHFTVTDTIDIVVPEHSVLSINYDQENKSCDVKTSADEKILGDRKDAKINNKNLEISTRNKIINVNQNKVKSKLCIQGVEKPGGDDDNVNKGIYDKDLKTYFKRKQTKCLKQLFLDNQDCIKINLDVEVNINLDVNNINSIYEKKSQKFCVCKDFGYFFYYDKDDDYQHIHYWEQKGAECSLDTLLSIYEDNKVYDVNINEPEYNEIETVKEDDQEQNSTDVCNICWMSVNSDIENEDLVEINKEAETRQITQSIEPQVKNTDEGKRNKPLHSQDVNRELQDVSIFYEQHRNNIIYIQYSC